VAIECHSWCAQNRPRRSVRCFFSGAQRSSPTDFTRAQRLIVLWYQIRVSANEYCFGRFREVEPTP
jgi:hypothetical protein